MPNAVQHAHRARIALLAAVHQVVGASPAGPPDALLAYRTGAVCAVLAGDECAVDAIRLVGEYARAGGDAPALGSVLAAYFEEVAAAARLAATGEG